MSWRIGKVQVTNRLESVAALKEAEIERWLGGLQMNLTAVAHSHEAQTLRQALLQNDTNSPVTQQDWANIATFLPAFEELFLMDLSGQVVLSNGPTAVGTRHQNQDYFQQGLHQSAIHPPYYAPTLARMTMLITQPLADEQGQPLSVIAGRVSLERLDEIMQERTGLGATGETYLVGANYLPLTSIRQTSTVETAVFRQNQAVTQAIETRQNGTGLYQNYQQEAVVGVYYWLPTLQAALLAEQTQAEALARFKITIIHDARLAAIALLVTLIVTYYVTRTLTQPLHDLTATAQQIANGDYYLTAKIERDDEIGTLSQAFNTMTGHLSHLITDLEQRVWQSEQSQAALKASEDRYRALYNNTPIMMQSVNDNEKIISVNDYWLETMGYTREEVIGRSITDFMTEETIRFAQSEVWPRFFEAGRVRDVPYRFVPKEGGVMDVLATSIAQYDLHGRFVYALTAVQDITERKRMEAQNSQVQEILDRALATMRDGFVVFDKDDRLVLCNEQYRKIYSKISDLIVPGLTFQAMVEASLKAGQIINSAFTNRQDDYVELRSNARDQGRIVEYYTSDGRWIEARDHPIADGGWIGIRIDITDRKQAQEKLRRSEERHRALLNAMPDMMFRANTAGILLDFKADQRQLAMSAQEIIGAHLDNTPLPPYIVHDIVQLIQQTVATNQMATYEYELQVPLGRHTFEARFFKSGLDEIIAIVRDITERKQWETTLRRSEELLNATNQIARTGGWELDLQTDELYWTDTIKEIHEVPADYVPRLEEGIHFYAPEHRAIISQAVAEAIQGQAYDLELQIITATQKRLWVRAIGVPIFEEGQVIRLRGVFQDIHQQKLVDEALRQSEERLRVIIHNAPLGIVVVGLDGRFQQVNSAMCQTVGYTEAELLTMSVADITHEPDIAASYQLIRAASRGEISGFEIEKRYVRQDGSLIMAVMHGAVMRDANGRIVALIGMLLDITERKESEAQVLASLREKEVLLKEIHHRVKNNLQVISSLLDLQANYVNDQQVYNMLQDSRSRVRSMALVHEQLYQAVDLARIDFTDYIERLVGFLFRSYGQQVGRIDLKLDIETVLLSVETAVPLGLIINELVSNAYKHAFGDGRSGQITIKLASHENQTATLIIQDNGIGLPPTLDIQNSPSLGLTIVNTLVSQLGGQLNHSQQNGTCFELSFPIQ
ncbi:MAG: PAS domain S-box protein [Ardenticatenaceae bacterium]|nr:PAS domain S-box protein [Ardenticatenaceae bacterium]